MRRTYLNNGKPEGCEAYRTVSELAEYLGLSARTIERRHKEGSIPKPAVVSGRGWKLWSPTQARNLLSSELERRIK